MVSWLKRWLGTASLNVRVAVSCQSAPQLLVWFSTRTIEKRDVRQSMKTNREGTLSMHHKRGCECYEKKEFGAAHHNSSFERR